MKPVKKIDDTLLLQMVEEGKEQKDIAAHFGVTPAAVCKRLKRLTRPKVFENLTPKEERFVIEMVKTNNQTQSALKAFSVGSLESAKSIGHRLMKDPDIKEAITAVMESEGLDRRYLVKKLKSHVDAPDPTVSLRAVDLGFKLHDVYPAPLSKNLNINADIEAPVDLEALKELFNH